MTTERNVRNGTGFKTGFSASLCVVVLWLAVDDDEFVFFFFQFVCDKDHEHNQPTSHPDEDETSSHILPVKVEFFRE